MTSLRLVPLEAETKGVPGSSPESVRCSGFLSAQLPFRSGEIGGGEIVKDAAQPGLSLRSGSARLLSPTRHSRMRLELLGSGTELALSFW